MGALSMCPFDDELSKPVHTFVYGTLETFRRIMWNCFRVENEQLHNVGQYRAIKEVPLPLHNNQEFQDRLVQVRALRKKTKHPIPSSVVPAPASAVRKRHIKLQPVVK